MTNVLPININCHLQASYTCIYDVTLIRNVFEENRNKDIIIGCDSFSRLHVISAPQQTTQNRINRKLQIPVHTHAFHLNSNHSVCSKGIFSLLSTEKFLFAGGIGGIFAWNIKDIYDVIMNQSHESSSTYSLPMPQSLWNITLDTPRGSLDSAEVNLLCYLPNRGSIVSAGARSSVAQHISPLHVFDIETGRLQSVGHPSLWPSDDYVHCVRARSSQSDELLTCSDKGFLHLWDLRASVNEPSLSLEPNSNADVARPRLGRFLRVLLPDASGTAVLCGGGPRLARWDLATRQCLTVCSKLLDDDTPVLAAALMDDVSGDTSAGDGHLLFTAGVGGVPQKWNALTCKWLATAPRSTLPHALALLPLPESRSLLSCGRGAAVELYSDIPHLEHTISLSA